MEESKAPMQVKSTEVTDAAPLSAALDTKTKTEAPTSASSESKPTKPSDETKSPIRALSSTTGEVDYSNWEFEPPLANIRRVLKPILAKGTNISKDSVTALSRAAGIFILYLSNCATDVAREGKRSTIAAKDVMKALKELDLEEFIPELEQFLVEHKKYEQTRKDEKDRSKKLNVEGTSGVGNKKSIRGADGKYVGTPTEMKEGDKDDTDNEDGKAEVQLASEKRDLGDEGDAGNDMAKKRKLSPEKDAIGLMQT